MTDRLHANFLFSADTHPAGQEYNLLQSDKLRVLGKSSFSRYDKNVFRGIGLITARCEAAMGVAAESFLSLSTKEGHHE